MEVLKMLGQIALLIIGFVFLIKGADLFVDGASKIAVKCNIPEMIVGLTIVALGTSAPEAAISIKAAFSNDAGMTVGNVLGSNILNVLLILGISSLFAALPIKKNTLRIDIPVVIIISVLMLCLGYFDGTLGRIDGVIFYVILIAFIIYLVISAKKGSSDSETIKVTEKDTTLKLILFIILGAALIVVGSNFTVNAASAIALKCGMTERLIGLTIVAFGTSLPELVTSCTAAKKGQTDIAIGNIVGSNIFNILFVAGTTTLITPVTFEKDFLIDGIVAAASAVLLFVCCLKNKKLTKTGGIVMLVCYAAYFAFIMYKNYA
ncbi:MAG: calcium/sodium antiporter [Coprococcus sp.]